MKVLTLFLAFLLTWSGAVFALPPRGSASPPAPATNASYPAPILNYATNGGCATNYYVNASTGSDSYDGTSQTFVSGTTGPWATITHAQSQLASGTHAATCINTASGTYAADFQTKCQGTTYSYAGMCTVRCAPNATTATARPALYGLSNGAQGSLPGCKVTNASSSDIQAGGVIATSNGTTAYNYLIVDGFEVTDLTTIGWNIASWSYSSGTGLLTATLTGVAVTNMTYSGGTVTLTLASSVSPSVVVNTTGFCVSGLTGTGSIAQANGCFVAGSGTTGTTVKYSISSGLTLGYTSGGSLTSPVAPTMCMTVAGVTGTGSSLVNGYQCATTGTLGSTVIIPIATGQTISASGGSITIPNAAGTGSAVGTAGIAMGPVPSQGLATGCHHCVFINNYVHDMGGAGIKVQSSEEYFILNNLVVNNAWTNPYSDSGIDVTFESTMTEPTFTAGPFDGQLGSYSVGGKTITLTSLIAGNYVSHTGNPISGTDGNAIIFDENNTTVGTCDSTRYNGSTGIFTALVYGNFAVLNAGRGTNLFNSSNVAVLNNSYINNALSVWEQNAASGGGPYGNCASNAFVRNNAVIATPAASGLASQAYAGQDTYLSPNPGKFSQWNNNVFYVNGTTTTCGGATTVGGTACINGISQIYSSGTKPAAWAIGTTYSGSPNNTFSGVTGTDGNTYASITSSSNVGHNPVTDAPTPGTQGSWWQNNGAPSNLFTNPLFTSVGPYQPNFTLQSGSPALSASGADVTGLGGYTVATPNIGAQ